MTSEDITPTLLDEMKYLIREVSELQELNKFIRTDLRKYRIILEPQDSGGWEIFVTFGQNLSVVEGMCVVDGVANHLHYITRATDQSHLAAHKRQSRMLLRTMCENLEAKSAQLRKLLGDK